MEADLVVTHGTIYTMDPGRPVVEAVAIGDGRIVTMGADADVRPLVGRGSQVLDLKGQPAIPGLTDAHVHLLSYGLSLEQVDLAGVPSLQDALERVRARVVGLPPGEWVTGRGWDRNLWSPPLPPTRQALDAVAPANPVALSSKDGHALWVNSLALRELGVDSATVDPEGGRIVRDATTGEATGILLEQAIDALGARIPPPSSEALRRAARAAMRRALSLGLTGVHNCEGGREMATLAGLWQEGALELRVYELLPREGLDAAIELGLCTGLGDEWLRVGHLKLFADGSLGSHTADMMEPYEGEGENRGVAVLEGGALESLIRRAVQARIAPAVHAIGDRANRRVLDAYATTRDEWARRGLRPRIEHVQVLTGPDIPRLAELGVVASMQPIHATSDMDMAEAYWGERSARAYAWRSLREAGTVLAFGSDCPVETLDPLAGIHAAATRQRPDGSPVGGWRSEQRLTVEEAVQAYTWGAAYAAGEERMKGTLAPGKVGDLVVLTQDIFRVAPAAIIETRVLATVCGGRLAYTTGELAVG